MAMKRAIFPELWRRNGNGSHKARAICGDVLYAVVLLGGGCQVEDLPTESPGGHRRIAVADLCLSSVNGGCEFCANDDYRALGVGVRGWNVQPSIPRIRDGTIRSPPNAQLGNLALFDFVVGIRGMFRENQSLKREAQDVAFDPSAARLSSGNADDAEFKAGRFLSVLSVACCSMDGHPSFLQNGRLLPCWRAASGFACRVPMRPFASEWTGYLEMERVTNPSQ